MSYSFEYISKRINYKGKEIQTYTFGTGSHVIFSFPSFPQSGLYYLFFAQHYNHRNYKFITFDLPGWSGWSENLFREDPTLPLIPTYLDIAEHVLKEYKVDKFSVIGYSFGAALAFMLAARNPERILRLALTSPVIFGGLTHQTKQHRLLGWVKRLNAHKLMRRRFRRRIESLLPDFRKLVSADLVDMYMTMYMRTDSVVLMNSIWELFNTDNEDLLPEVGKVKNILIVNSQEEDKLFRMQAEHLRRHLPSEHTLKIHGTHDDFILRPKSETVEQVMNFLTGN
jgi:pimeloyl-ACP methyl ester carboxylesterase